MGRQKYNHGNKPYIFSSKARNGTVRNGYSCIKCGENINQGDLVVQRVSHAHYHGHLGSKQVGHLQHAKCFVDAKGNPIFE